MQGFYTVRTARPAIAAKPPAKPIAAWNEDDLRRAMMATTRPIIGEREYRSPHDHIRKSQADEAARDRARRWKASLQRFQIMRPHMDRPKTIAQISAACGLEMGETAGTMKALHKRGVVVKAGATTNTGKTPIWIWALADDWFSKIGGE